MESDNSIFNAQGYGSESNQVSTNCLSVNVILRKIMENFSTAELLQLSLVNKQWNYEARSLMKSRGNLTKRIDRNDTCEDLRAFASDLQRMKHINKIVPFSGMTIALRWHHKDWPERSSAGKLDAVYEDIVEQMTWKHLVIRFDSYWEEQQDCPAFLLLKKILKNAGSILEELSVSREWRHDRIPGILQGWSFPRLHTLKLLPWTWPMPYISKENTKLVKTLVNSAPKLQVLYTKDCFDLRENLLAGSSAVHVTNYQYSPSTGEIPESVVGQLRMERLRLRPFGRDIGVDHFKRMTPVLLQLSRATLKSVEISAVFLLPLLHYGIILENVQSLKLYFQKNAWEISQPVIKRAIECFDFTRIFPNLSTVRIDLASSSRENLEYTANAFTDMIGWSNLAILERAPEGAVNIKKVTLPEAEVNQRYVQFFANLFPNTQNLSVETTSSALAVIWDLLPNLKKLDVTLLGWSPTGWGSHLVNVQDLHFDSAFCGIFPEEVAQLLEEDEEYLRKVNIVPVKPSISCLKDLRTLNLTFGYIPLDRFTRKPYILKVTTLVAFQKFTALTVNLTQMMEEVKRALSYIPGVYPTVDGG